MLDRRHPPVRPVRVLGALLLLLAGLVAGLPAWAQGDLFTVRDVRVDITAASAAAAREQAIVQAQRQAFVELFGRLTAGTEGQQPPELSDAELAQLVQDFEVQAEQASAVRYLATLTVRFRPEAVRARLFADGIRFTEVRSKPVLVLPVYQAEGEPVLWQHDTPWRTAWADLPPPDGLVPVVVPYGDLRDVTAIDAGQALAGAPEAIAEIAARYQVGSVLVAHMTVAGADPDPAAGATVALHHHHLDGRRDSQALQVPGLADGTLEAFMEGTVRQVVAALEADWARTNLVETGEVNALELSVPVSDLEGWLEVRRRLEQVPTVTDAPLVSLTRTEARLRLHYRGDLARLRTALAQQDLALTEQAVAPPLFDAPAAPEGSDSEPAGRWELRLDTRPPGARPPQSAATAP